MTVIARLLRADDPAVRYKTLVGVLGLSPDSVEVAAVREEVRASERVRRLLAERDADGRIPHGPYAKWYGAHWVLTTLADIGYSPGDESLIPLREQEYAWLLSDKHEKAIRTLQGRVRRCASQEAYAVFALLTLGLADSRTEELVARLLRWQWADGGWNCDKRPAAINSSFSETLIPLRSLALHARLDRRCALTRGRRPRRRSVPAAPTLQTPPRRADPRARLHPPALSLLLALRRPLRAQSDGRGRLHPRCALRGRARSAGEQTPARRRLPGRVQVLPGRRSARELRITRGLGRYERKADERIRDGRGAGRAQGRRSIASGCELRSRECGLPCAAVGDRIRLGDRIGLATRGLRHRCDSMSWLNSWSNTASA